MYRHTAGEQLSISEAIRALLIAWIGVCAGCGGGGETTQTPTTLNNPANYSLAVDVDGAGAVTSSPAGISCGSTCRGDYAYGMSVTLSAAPAAGYALSGWSVSGVSCAGTGPCTVPMTANRTVTASFVPTSSTLTIAVVGSGIVSSSPGGINCGSDCTESFSIGTSVTLSAAPAAGHAFSGWSGSDVSCPGTGNCTLSMTSARDVTATFTQIALPNYTLQVNRSGSGTVTSSPGGIACGSTCSASYVSSTAVSLAAAPTAGFVFTGWSGGGCSGTGACSVSMTAARTVSATFVPATYTLTVGVTGSGSVSSSPAGISCGGDCSEAYTSGTSVTLTATAASGHTFSGWSGSGIACSGTGSCTVSMTAARNVTATFSALPSYTLTVSLTGSGTISSAPAGIACGGDCTENYTSGVSVTLTASAASGYTFSGWGGACSGVSTTCIVSMTAARGVSAAFTASSSGSVPLAWEAPNQNVDGSCLTDLTGYELHRGPSQGNYTVSETIMVNAVSCANSGESNACGAIQTCTYTVNNLPDGTWHFALRAFDAIGEISSYSNDASITMP